MNTADGAPPVRKSFHIGLLYKYSTPNERIFLAIGSVCAFIEGAAFPAFTFVFGSVLNTIGENGSNIESQMNKLALAMALISFSAFVLATTWSTLFSITAVRQANRLRRAYLGSILGKDIAWFDMHTPGEIPSRLSSDIEKFQNAISQKAGMALMNISQAISGMLLGFVQGWQVALVVLAGIPFLSIAMLFLTKSMGAASSASQSSYAKAGSIAEEVLTSIRTVASFGGECFELDRYSSHLGEAKKNGIRIGVQVGLSLGIVMLTVFLSYALTFWFGAWLIVNDVTNNITGEPWTGSQVIIVFFAVLMGTFGLGQIGPSISAFAEGTAALKGLFEAIETRSLIEPSLMRPRPDGTLVCRKVQLQVLSKETIEVETIEFQNVKFLYPSRPDVPVLGSLSFAVRAGQKVALVGESGSGKSTIVALLERFYDPLEGSIMINGTDIRSMNPKNLRRLFGYVGQEPVMFATSIRGDLTYGMAQETLPSDQDIQKVLRMANIHVFVDSLPEGLDTYCGPGGSQMSGGQKQRIAIARALLREPQILLLDEATSALDNDSEKQVQATIDQLQQKTSLTTISVAHRLSTIRNSDVIFVLSKGELVEQGTHAALMDVNGLYRSLVSTQAAVVSVSQTVEHEEETIEVGSMHSEKIVTEKRSDLTAEQIEKLRIATVSKQFSIPWKRLFSYTRQERWLYLSGIIGAFAKGVAFPLHAYMFSAVISWYYDKTDLMSKVSLEYVALGVGVFIGIVMALSSFAVIGESFTLRIRRACFKHILGQNMAFFDDPENAPGKLQLALSTWATKMNSIITNVIGVFFEVIAALTAGLIIAFLDSPKLAGILCACLPLLIISSALMTSVMLGGGGGDNSMSKQAALVASEAISNMRTVRALTAETTTLEIYEQLAMRKVAEDSRKAWIGGFLFGFSMMTAIAPYGLAYYVGGKMVADGDLDLRDMTQAIIGLLLGSMAAGQALSFLPDVAQAKTAAHDIFKLLDTRSQICPFDVTDRGTSLIAPAVITLDNVWFAYPQRPKLYVLKGLSFSVHAGQKVALVGPSGGGKSTVMALLQRFYDPSSGSVRFGSTNITDINVATLRAQMGYVGQEPVLFDATLEENIMYGNANATKEDLERVAIMAKLDFLAPENVHWTTKIGPKGSLLSGGQKQRVAIARALNRNPSILLLDEATSALDSASETVVQKAIDEATIGRTTFVIAHRLSTIEDADLILVIADGTVIEQGTHTEMMQSAGPYSQLYYKGQK